ncbi:hypothetical protein [Collimonas antrihumi]|uniref:hypothetical protein n=1 Tax=Collimonas antrihumi TaxID=1940615 RepID=UPI001B8CEC06|nr:hypothetical protein [Collimonas antrihumi]
MKLYLLASLCALASFSLAIAAESPLDGSTLAQVDAIVAHCGQINPADSARYQDLLKPVIADVSADDLATIRKSEVYQQAYETITAQLVATKKDDVVAACAGAIAANN